MDLTTVKSEPPAVNIAEEEGGQPHWETEYVSCPGIKVESLDHYSPVDQGSVHLETVPIKAEPEPLEEDEEGIPDVIDIDLLDVKKECIEHSESIIPMSDSQPIKEEPKKERKVVESSDSLKMKSFMEIINMEYKKKYKKSPAKRQSAMLKGKVFPCNQCTAVFPKKNQLDIHLNVHSGEKPFSCLICSSVFSQKSNWKTHMLAHEGVKPFVCPHCSVAFTRKMCLKTHILTHTGERPFACTQCSSAFTHESSYILTHYGLKPFSCDQCSSAFSRKTGLDRHFLTHSGEKPFPCGQCGSAFTRKSSLQTHMLSHTGVKPFACYLCSFTCSVSISLKRHILTHTGEKPFSCPLCDYRCSQKSRLKNHIRRHNEKSQTAELLALRAGEVSTSAPQTEAAETPHETHVKPDVGI